jgi:hypothetical protein
MTVIIDPTTGYSGPAGVPLPRAQGGTGAIDNPAFSAYQNINQTIPNTTATKILFQVKEFDTAAAYDVSTSRFTPQVAGYYQINGNVFFNSVLSTIFSSVYKNGSEWKRGEQSASAANALSSSLVLLNGTTDFIEIYLYQASGASATTNGLSSLTYFQGFLVRSA